MPKRSLPNNSEPNRLMVEKLDQAITELLAAPDTKFQSDPGPNNLYELSERLILR